MQTSKQKRRVGTDKFSDKQLTVFRLFGPGGYSLGIKPIDTPQIMSLYDEPLEERRLTEDVDGDYKLSAFKTISREKRFGRANIRSLRPTVGAFPRPRRLDYERHVIFDKVSPVPLFWNIAENSTRKNIQDCLVHEYKENDYSKDVFMKIKETNTDLKWLSDLHKIDDDKYFEFLTPVRFLNEAVYCMDTSIENTNNVSNGVLNQRSKMFWNAQKFIKYDVKRDDLLHLLPNIMWTIEANAARETVGLQPELRDLDYISGFFKEFFEPSDKEYLDIGFYGTFFDQWFKKKVRDKGRFRSIWNNRCRATDVIDGIIDLEEDIEERNASPLLLSIYGTTDDYEEMENIRKTISSGKDNKQFQETVKNHSINILNKLQDYNDNIFPTNSKVKKLKERTYDIIDLGVMLAEQPWKVEEYNNYYLDTPIELTPINI